MWMEAPVPRIISLLLSQYMLFLLVYCYFWFLFHWLVLFYQKVIIKGKTNLPFIAKQNHKGSRQFVILGCTWQEENI